MKAVTSMHAQLLKVRTLKVVSLVLPLDAELVGEP